MELFVLAILIFNLIVFGFFCSWLAGEKGRDTYGWFILGGLFGIFALLALGLAPSLKAASSVQKVEKAQPAQVTEETKQCPYCMETIKLQARKCRYCGTEFAEDELEEHLNAQRKKKESVDEARKLEFEEVNKRRKQRLAESGEGLRLAIAASDVAQLEEMLSLGANPNADLFEVPALFETPALLFAIRKGNLQVIEALIKAGANVKSTRGLLHAAVKAGSVDIVKLLLLNGANIDEKSLFGSTPLQLAEKIQPKNGEVIWALKTAPLRFKCPKCETLFEVAQEFRGKQGTCRSCNTRVQVPKKLS